jgi:hypothetical protein
VSLIVLACLYSNFTLQPLFLPSSRECMSKDPY